MFQYHIFYKDKAMIVFSRLIPSLFSVVHFGAEIISVTMMGVNLL